MLTERIAAACGRLLGTLHGGSWRAGGLRTNSSPIATLFDQLRVDPYYRTLAAVRPEAREPLERLIASLEMPGRALVHGDFSPKNLPVSADALTMVDFETGH